MAPKNILFLCQDNAVRSIMAEAYLNLAGRPLARAYSAGLSPAAAVGPGTLAMLRSVGLKTGGLSPKSLESFSLPQSPRMDLVVALCGLSELQPIPPLPGTPPVREWRVGDEGLLAGRQDAYIDVFGEIRMMVDSLLFDLPGVAPVRVSQVA